MPTTRRQLLSTGSALAVGAALAPRAIGHVGAQEPVTISWWHISTQEDISATFQAKADAFMAANPGVTIEITILENEAFKQKIATAMQSGEPPDVFHSWGGGVLTQYGEAGLVQDLTAALAEGGWGDSFSPAALALYSDGEKNWGVPTDAGMVGMWYRTDLFAQAGIETFPETWAEFLSTVQTLKDAGITPIAVGEGDKWPGHFYWVYLAIRMGGKAAFDAAYDRSGSFADQPFIDAGQHLADLVALEPFQPDFLAATYTNSNTMVANGQAAIELMGQWELSTLDDSAEDKEALAANIAFAGFPAVEGGAGDPSDVLGGGGGYAIGKNAPQAAVDFVRYMTSLEVQTELTELGITVPPVVAGAEVAVENPILQDITARVASAGYYQLYYDQFLPPAVGATVNDSVQGIFAGTLSPQEVAEAIEASAAAEL